MSIFHLSRHRQRTRSLFSLLAAVLSGCAEGEDALLQEPYSFVVHTGPAAELPAYGGAGGSGFREQCPNDSVLTNLRVQNRSGCTSPGICYEVVGDLIGECSQVQVRLEGSAWTVSLVPMSTLMVLGSDAARGMYVAPPGPYAGLWLRTGAFVDELSVGQTDLRLELR